MKAPLVGCILDDSPHYIDHLAPFCSLHRLSLILCEERVADLMRRFYPDVIVIQMNRDKLSLPSSIVCCDSKILIKAMLRNFRMTYVPNRFFWLPHGHSDKGWKRSFFEALSGEIVCAYGQNMIDSVNRVKGLSEMIRVGNFRLSYWKKHKSFYDTLMKEKIGWFGQKKTYLYAPTWDDSESNSSFWKMLPLLIGHLPDSCNLVIKTHPNTEAQYAPKIEQWIGLCAQQSNIFFVSEFPPIYPLLNLCDAYIGDMSSIGYDFLYFNRPMFFLKDHDNDHFLYRCGIEVSSTKIHSIFSGKHDDFQFKKKRKQVYDYTFDSDSQFRF